MKGRKARKPLRPGVEALVISDRNQDEPIHHEQVARLQIRTVFSRVIGHFGLLHQSASEVRHLSQQNTVSAFCFGNAHDRLRKVGVPRRSVCLFFDLEDAVPDQSSTPP